MINKSLILALIYKLQEYKSFLKITSLWAIYKINYALKVYMMDTIYPSFAFLSLTIKITLIAQHTSKRQSLIIKICPISSRNSDRLIRLSSPMRRKMPISSSIHSSMHIFPSSYWGMLRLEVEVLRSWWNGLIITLMFIIKFHRRFICLLTALIGKVFFKQKNTKQRLSLLIKTITLWNRINLLADMRFKLKMRESFKLLEEL